MKQSVDRIRALINQAFAHDGEPLVVEPDDDLIGVLDSLQVLRLVVAPDGWFSTHDVGEQDSNGCLYLRGRTKDVISVFGMKFFPQ